MYTNTCLLEVVVRTAFRILNGTCRPDLFPVSNFGEIGLPYHFFDYLFPDHVNDVTFIWCLGHGLEARCLAKSWYNCFGQINVYCHMINCRLPCDTVCTSPQSHRELLCKIHLLTSSTEAMTSSKPISDTTTDIY